VVGGAVGFSKLSMIASSELVPGTGADRVVSMEAASDGPIGSAEAGTGPQTWGAVKRGSIIVDVLVVVACTQ